MERSILIQIPEGYDDAVFNSETNKIEFVKKDSRPKSWEEFCNMRAKSSEYATGYYLANSEVYTSTSVGADCKTIMYTREEAEAFLALMQLRLLRKAWIGNWKPDWSSVSDKWCISVCVNSPGVFRFTNHQRALTFPTEQVAREFLNCFRDLIEKAKIIL